MENLYSVRIIRRENQVVSGVYIKEFWMFCGVYVNEFIIEQDKVSGDKDKVTCNTILQENGVDIDELKADYNIKVTGINDSINLLSKDRRISFGNQIKGDILGISKCLKWNKNGVEEFKRLYEAFVNSDFAYNNYLTHLFLEQFGYDMKMTQLEILNNCMDEIYARDEEIEGLIYRRFAYFNCARKINRICDSLKVARVFKDERVMIAAHELSVENEEFTMGNVLAGLIGLSKKKLWLDGEIYIQKALDREAYNKYSAFIYYALAHYYEKQRKNKKEAWRLYQNMRKVDSNNYRMLFKYAAYVFYKNKYATHELHKNSYINSWILFFELYNLIERQVDRGWIQPLELEYYYKCARILSDIPEDKAVRMGMQPIKAEDIKRIEVNDFQRSNFMNKILFNDNLREVYKKYFRDKMESYRLDNIVEQY